MATNIFQRIQDGLAEKRQNVTEFINTAPELKIELCCEDKQEIQAHLQVIDTALDELETQTLGLCDVCHGYIDPSRLEMDYTARVCLEHLSELERRRLEAELELSQIVQRALLPQTLPEISGVEISAFLRPAEIIGGDYFDFFNFRDGTPGLVIADITGHGVSAGMLMSSLQTAIRTMAPETDSPSEILERINRFYIHNINFTTFVTVFLARFEPAEHLLTFVSAGHNPPVLYHKREGRIAWLKPTAPAIGLVEEFHPKCETIALTSGDVLLLYTDGVTEVINAATQEQYGAKRLADLLQQNADLASQEIIQTVRKGIDVFGDGKLLEDDATLVALKMLD